METPYKLLAIDAAKHTLLVINGLDGQILAELSYAPENTPIALIPANNQRIAYIPMTSNDDSGSLFSLNLDDLTLKCLPIVIPAPAQFTLAPDGNTAYIVGIDGSLYVLNITMLNLTCWGQPAATAVCVGLAADDTGLYSAWEHSAGGTIIVFGHDGEPIQEYHLAGIPTNITLDGCGHIIVPFTSTVFTGEGVVVFDINALDSRKPTVLTTNCCARPGNLKIYPTYITIAPNKKNAYIVNEDSGSISVVDIEAAIVTDHFSIGRSVSCLHLLPDSRFGIASSHMFADLALIDLVNGRLISVTDTKREILGYIAVIEN